jgi:branched-chain amino acid transport system substrate-binding protein
MWPVSALLVILIIALGTSGCGSAAPQSTAGSEGEPYKIGALVAITGGMSSLGVPERNTLEMLKDEVNAAGGIKGPDGLMHPLEVIIYDTESEETKAVIAAKKLTGQDRVSVIIGPTTSGNSMAVLDTIQKAEIPMIAMATSDDIVNPVEDRKWAFKVTWLNSANAEKMAQYLQARGHSRLGCLVANNAYGLSGLTEFEKLAPDYGIEIVASEKYEKGDTDMTAQLTKIKASGAEALRLWGTIPELAIASRNAYELGLEIPKLAQGGASHPKYVEVAGKEAIEGTISAGGKFSVAEQLPDSDPQKERILSYSAEYEAKFGEEANNFGGHAWDAFHWFVQAMEKAGDDPAAIRDELEKIENFVGVNGVFTTSPQDHVGMSVDSIAITQIRDGRFEFVE